MKQFPFTLLLSCATALILSGCGGDDEGNGAEEFPPYDNTDEVDAYYKENSAFFVVASPDDVPSDLNWENGADLPEIGSPEAKKGGIWHDYVTDFPRTLRQIGPDANGSFRTWQTDMLMLWAPRHPNAEGHFPGLAEEWALDRETATVFVRINPEARWSDGEPITTEDVFFGFYFHQTKHNNAPWYQNFYDEMYKNITKYDDHTFSITVAQKKPDFHQYVLLTSPTPRHFYKEYGPDFVQRYQWRFQPTTGPYVINDKDIKKGKSIALTRNKEWWAKDNKFWKNRYNPDRIELAVIREPEKAFEVFLKGDRDLARLNLAKFWFEKLPDDHPAVQDGYIQKANFYNNVPQSSYNLWFNTSKPLLDNVEIRKGIAHATNWDLVIDQVFRGMWARIDSTSMGFGETDHPTLKSREYSVEKATAHFAKAGFDQRGPDGIFVNSAGDRLSFTLTTGYKTLSDVMTVLEREARKAGLELKLEILESTSAWKKTQEKKHEICLTGFSFGVEELYPRYWEAYHGDNAYEDGKVKTQTNNLTMVDDDELDAVIIKYRESESHEEKVKLAHQLEEMIAELALTSNGVYLPSYRVGYWRWVRWPEDFNVMRSEIEQIWMVHWIDEDAKAETKAAMKSGKKFPPVVKDYDKFKP